MNESPEMRPPPDAPAARAADQAFIRESALGLLLGGGICLYFGLTLAAIAPANSQGAAVEQWWAIDNALFWALRIVGILFVLAAGFAATGRRAALLVTIAAESLFTLLMLAMSIIWTLKARVDGEVNYIVILLILMAIVSIAAIKRSWVIYGRLRPNAAALMDRESPNGLR